MNKTSDNPEGAVNPAGDTEAILNRRKFLIQAALASAGVGASIADSQAAEPQICLSIMRVGPEIRRFGEWGEWKDNRRGPIFEVVYPRGEANGTIAKETELFQVKDPQTGQVKEVAGDVYEWKLSLVSEAKKPGTEVFWVENKGPGKRKFIVERWEVRFNGNLELEQKGEKLGLIPHKSGEHEIMAAGKIQPAAAPFKVSGRKILTAPAICLKIAPPRPCLSVPKPPTP